MLCFEEVEAVGGEKKDEKGKICLKSPPEVHATLSTVE
jgi:hypothetical protein